MQCSRQCYSLAKPVLHHFLVLCGTINGCDGLREYLRRRHSISSHWQSVQCLKVIIPLPPFPPTVTSNHPFLPKDGSTWTDLHSLSVVVESSYDEYSQLNERGELRDRLVHTLSLNKSTLKKFNLTVVDLTRVGRLFDWDHVDLTANAVIELFGHLQCAKHISIKLPHTPNLEYTESKFPSNSPRYDFPHLEFVALDIEPMDEVIQALSSWRFPVLADLQIRILSFKNHTYGRLLQEVESRVRRLTVICNGSEPDPVTSELDELSQICELDNKILFGAFNGVSRLSQMHFRCITHVVVLDFRWIRDKPPMGTTSDVLDEQKRSSLSFFIDPKRFPALRTLQLKGVKDVTDWAEAFVNQPGIMDWFSKVMSEHQHIALVDGYGEPLKACFDGVLRELQSEVEDAVDHRANDLRKKYIYPMKQYLLLVGQQVSS